MTRGLVRSWAVIGILLFCSSQAGSQPTYAGPRTWQDPDDHYGSDHTADRPLNRHDSVPPETISLLLGWSGGGGGLYGNACTIEPDGSMTMLRELDPVPCVLPINSVLNLDVSSRLGWPENGAAFSVRAPDGAPVSPIEIWGADHWWIEPGAPTGTYRVDAQWRDQTLTGSFSVLLGDGTPTLAVDQRKPGGEARPEHGATFRFFLAGFEPNRDIELLLYRGEMSAQGLAYAFQTRLGTVRSNHRGEAVYSLDTEPDDPAGPYAVYTVPRSFGISFPRGRTGEFCVRPVGPDQCQRSQEELPEPPPTALVRLAVHQAALVWATVNANASAPLEHLECGYAEGALSNVRAALQQRRARGERLEARLRTPVEVVYARYRTQSPGDESMRIEAAVRKSWMFRTIGPSGAVAPAEERDQFWSIELLFSPVIAIADTASAPANCESGWVITRAELLS